MQPFRVTFVEFRVTPPRTIEGEGGSVENHRYEFNSRHMQFCGVQCNLRNTLSDVPTTCFICQEVTGRSLPDATYSNSRAHLPCVINETNNDRVMRSLNTRDRSQARALLAQQFLNKHGGETTEHHMSGNCSC